MSSSHVSIVGGGIAGLVLGQCLRKRQIPATIWEKTEKIPRLQNFGITLRPNVYQSLLQHLELDESALRDATIIKDASGHIRVNRSAFIRLMAKDLDIRWNHTLTGLIARPDTRQKLSLTNDKRVIEHESDLVFVTDGVHSKSRTSLLSKDAFQLQVLPFVVYNGKRRFPADHLPDGLEACLTVNGISHSIDKTLLQITSGYYSAEDNEIGINYTLSRPAETPEDQELLMRSNADAESLARRILEEASKLTDLKEPFKSVFNPDVMKDDRLLHWLMRSGLVDPASAEKLAIDGVVLLGDASSPQPILGGAGANAAILDALRVDKAFDGRINIDAYSALQKDWQTWKDEAEQSLERMHQPAARASI